MAILDRKYNLGCVWLDSNSLGTAFAAHEINHAFGFDHSYDNTQSICADGGAPGEYCDPWDAMSCCVTFYFDDRNWLVAGNSTGSGRGMSAPNLSCMGWLPCANQRHFFNDGDEQTFTIRALSHPQSGQPLVVILDVGGSGPFDGIYTVEYRQGDGWDLGIVSPAADAVVPPFLARAVLVHQFRSAGAPASTLIASPDKGARQPGSTLVLTSPAGPVYHVTVESIDKTNGRATVSIGHGRPAPLPLPK